MAAPTLFNSGYTTANTQTTLTAVAVVAGDLIVFSTMSGDATPTVAISVTSGSATFDRTSFDGTNYDIRKADGTNSLYVHIWSTRVLTSSSGTCTFTVSGWATTAGRRWGYAAYRPGSGDTWGASPVYATASSDTTGSTHTNTWSATTPTVPVVTVGASFHTANSSVTWDFDNSGASEGTEFSNVGNPSVSQLPHAAYALWDTSAWVPTSSACKLSFGSAGTKCTAQVVYKVAAPTTVTGTAAGAGGGTGAVTGIREVLGTSTGAGGGVGAVAGTQEVIASLGGLGGGVGTAAGIRTVIGVAAGLGGGVGSAFPDSVRLGTATGLGGGVGVGAGASTVIPPERALVLNHNTLAVLEG